MAQRTQTTPVSRFVSDVPRSDWAGTPNALAAFGSHREGTQGKRPIVIGLRCNAAGHPVSLAVFPGKTPDPHTFAAQLNKGKARFGVTALPCVGDRGMRKGQQIEDLVQPGCHDMTAMTKPQMEQLLRTGTWQMALCDQEVAEVLADAGRRYVRRRHPVRAQEVRDTRQAKLATLQALGTQYQQYLTDHPRATPQGAWQKLVARASTLRMADWVELTLAERSITLPVHASVQPEAATRDGCDGLQTALTPQQANQEMVHDRYTELASVEPALRTCKTAHLAVRPIFLRRAARTRAQAFVVRLA